MQLARNSFRQKERFANQRRREGHEAVDESPRMSSDGREVRMAERDRERTSLGAHIGVLDLEDACENRRVVELRGGEGDDLDAGHALRDGVKMLRSGAFGEEIGVRLGVGISCIVIVGDASWRIATGFNVVVCWGRIIIVVIIIWNRCCRCSEIRFQYLRNFFKNSTYDMTKIVKEWRLIIIIITTLKFHCFCDRNRFLVQKAPKQVSDERLVVVHGRRRRPEPRVHRHLSHRRIVEIRVRLVLVLGFDQKALPQLGILD